ncbi:DUF4333 domain-containing protein [Nonomuraea sp. B12E4]|uniref:DUF4333 domain-containing protein n=1 Tax=Nonomuraea sp. B12E4 TaxID=3153564 RepID=UPI00325F2724
MADQRNFARIVVAVSSVVVAACAVAVTIKAMNTDVVPVQRVLDQEALERQVIDQVGEPGSQLTCPASIVVEVGNQFECRLWRAPNKRVVRVTVVSDQGEVSASSIG